MPRDCDHDPNRFYSRSGFYTKCEKCGQIIPCDPPAIKTKKPFFIKELPTFNDARDRVITHIGDDLDYFIYEFESVEDDVKFRRMLVKAINSAMERK